MGDGSTSVSVEEMKKKVELDESSSSGSASPIGTPTHKDSFKPLMEFRDSASLTNEEAGKRRKLDISSSSGSDSKAKQGEGSEEAASTSVPTSSVRNPDDTDSSSEPAPVSSSSHSLGASASTTAVYNKRTRVYEKSLTQHDVSRGELMIPIEYGRKFLPEPQEHDGIYETIKVSFLDHNGQIWPMDVEFLERISCYMLGLNWDRYVKKFKLEAEDTIFIYHDPNITTFDHYLIEYKKKKGCDSNSPKETT